MKIYNKKEFFKLQTPIIFSRYIDGTFQGLYYCTDFLQGERGEFIDYVTVDLLCAGIMPKLTDETLKSYKLRKQHQPDDFGYAFIESGSEFELDLDCGGRDGLFDDEEKFVVYHKADLLSLINKLQELYIDKYTI
jgi:hypothetical protein